MLPGANSRRLELRPVRGLEVEPEFPAAVPPQELARELRPDVAPDLVAAGPDGRADVGGNRLRVDAVTAVQVADGRRRRAERRSPPSRVDRRDGAVRDEQDRHAVRRLDDERKTGHRRHEDVSLAEQDDGAFGGRAVRLEDGRPVNLRRPCDRKADMPEAGGEFPRQVRGRGRLVRRGLAPDRKRDEGTVSRSFGARLHADTIICSLGARHC